MSIHKMSPEEVQARMVEIPAWKLEDEALHRRFLFKNFQEAFAFMVRVAILAEKADHHPEWSNVYRTVDIRLSTHEAGGISERDFALAIAIDNLVETES